MRCALSILAVVVAGCGSSPTSTPPVAPPPTAVTPTPAPPVASPDGPPKTIVNTTLAAVGLDATALDRTADPCEDFYQFACGGWMARTEIPADKPMAMRSFVDIEDRNLEYLRGVLDQARTAPGNDPLLAQLGAFYGACMDEATAEKAGLRPVQTLLATIRNIKDARTLTTAITALHVAGHPVLFGFGPTEDFADATKVIGEIAQGGLGLPDRDYYLKDDDATKALRTAYTEYVTAMLVHAGRTPAAAKAAATNILELETALAKASKDKVAMRDPKSLYNKIDRAGVQQAMPHFDWNVFFKALDHGGLQDITVTTPDFLPAADALIAKTRPAVWRDYLTVHVLGAEAPYLTSKIYATRFALDSKLTGQQQPLPRWKRCVRYTDTALPDLLGQVFVRDRFAGDSKAAAEAQVAAIRAAMQHDIDALTWMDPATKQKAREKLAAMAHHIGYPERWHTYDFTLDGKAFAANVAAARRWEARRQRAKIGKPVDRSDWSMSAPTVNAYYNPLHNTIVFPAGILQPPFYSVNHSVAVNLGGMGFVVGHEITHGFDDQGSQFDANGNLASWWQPATRETFEERTQCVVDQYSTYDAGGGKVNGKLTLGENIADIGGVKLALAAYRALRASAPETEVADGFTEDQQFFLSAGQIWCAKLRPEFEAMLVNVDPHSPMKWRVNGTLAATPDFARAFRCKPGSAMHPARACVVW